MPQKTAITFEEFMQRALYDPVHGYYTRRITGVGRRGDFTTAPMISDAPARAIASWVCGALRETACHHLIEIGPGEGKLAASVLRNLPWHVRWRTRLHLVETSGPLTEIQRNNLGHKATWHSTLTAALAACDGNAVIFSNELVDAFPVRRFQHTSDDWQELALKFETNNIPEEILLAPAPLPESTSFSQNHPLDQWIEVHDSYRRWLQEWLPMWKRGKMLTIDYGAVAQDLYHRRPRGTIRGYLLQQHITGSAIYQNTGRQDLTADVNFTDLMQWSSPWTEQQKLQTFAAFLKSHAPLTDHPFTDDQTVGGAFFVLEETRKSTQCS